MKENDIVTLRAHTNQYSRGVIGNTYKIAEIKKTELKLCSLETNDYCFYTHPDNISVVVEMSVPAGMEFGVDYDIDDLWTRSNTIYMTNESEEFATKLDSIAKNITDLLKEKNKAYGNTALNPPQIFSKLNATEAICARLDDKISRIQNKGINDKTEDTVDDLIGYLLLLKMSM
jgi:hypothetical protein